MKALFFANSPLKERGIKMTFVKRQSEGICSYDKWETLQSLESIHRKAVSELGFSWDQLWRAEQVHGSKVAIIPDPQLNELTVRGKKKRQVIEGVDALVTQTPGVLLGIYVADCGAVYCIDQRTRAIGLAHSGKKGTEEEIVKNMVQVMKNEYGSREEDLFLYLAPCIRPPHYEVDFAQRIGEQIKALGVAHYEDCGLCTASDLKAYYSYRMEQGYTGRMLALLGIQQD